MITPELIQQTESRFAERQATRQEHEAKIREGAILEADTPERVRQRLRHITSAIVETEGVGLPTAGQPAVPAIERILGRSDFLSVRYFELGVRVARSVGRIHVRTPKGSGFGTGFLVAPQLVLTNNHVFENASVAGDSRVEFDFQEGADGKLRSSIFLNFDPATFFVTDKALDFSLVALKGDVRNLAKLGFNGLSADEGKVIVGEYVSIIQHPSGERKQVALRENQIVDVLDNFLHYKTDTSPGSSGSPVFNDQWEIVALHHSGIPQRDSSGRILTRDGKVWNAGMGEQAVHWIANEGVRISRILKHLQGLTLSGAQATLRKQLLDAEKGWRGDASASELAGALGEAAEIGAGGTAWTLPLPVTIEIGQSASGMQLSATAAPRQAAAPMPRAEAVGNGQHEAVPAEDELAAWRSLESARGSPELAPLPVESALEWLTGPGGGAPAVQDPFGREWVSEVIEPGGESRATSDAYETFGRDDVEKADKIGKHFLDLLRFEVPATLVQMLAARKMRVQTLESATGKLNLDFYPVQVSKLPTVGNKQLTTAELLKRIRLNINNFIDTDYSKFEPYDAIDAPVWNSDSPLGAVLYINIRGPDNAAVLCAHATDRMWRFAALEAPRSGEHPVSGVREFGFRETVKGLIFYTRAADRTTSVPPGLDLIAFSSADRLWRSFQQKIAKFVNGNSGEATVLKPLSEQISWTPVKVMYNLSASGQGRKESSTAPAEVPARDESAVEWLTHQATS
jgi:trypsin-like peptidase